MRVLASPLCRVLLRLLPHCGPVGVSPAKGSILKPCKQMLRQNFSDKAEQVTTTELVSYWRDVFEANGIPEAQESSEYIVSHVLGAKTFQTLKPSSLFTPLTKEQQQQIQQLCAKRLQRMPVQYVLGEWDFQDLTLKMKPPVFIPRPETEFLLLPWVSEQRDQRLRDASLYPVILEVGCGSGAVALSLLSKLPHSQVIALDKAEAAVNLTRENAESVHPEMNQEFGGSWEQLVPWGPVDIIISNPPYVFHEDMTHLEAEILRYEDLDALDGGDDGMRVIKEILMLASYLLKDEGSVFLEVDPRHPEMVKNWLQSHPDLLLSFSATHKDFCAWGAVYPHHTGPPDPPSASGVPDVFLIDSAAYVVSLTEPPAHPARA
uniref:peptide chain release factor N(5)-glutamine methyltransferase n=1 Tax=Sphenodon punctatus TaxID=8508 RepID=A0A8D0G2V8_SPHPU